MITTALWPERFGPERLRCWWMHAAISAALCLWAMVASPTAHADSAAEVGLTPLSAFERRTYGAALDAQCRLLTPAARGVLAVTRDQVRQTLSANGVREADIAARERQVFAQAAMVSCDSEEAAATATSLQNAFNAWARLRSMRFSGLYRSWVATRATHAGSPGWLAQQPLFRPTREDERVAQQRPAAAFGLLQDGETRRLAVVLPGQTPVRAARLAMRDANTASATTAERLRRVAPQNAVISSAGPDPVLSRLAPPALLKTHWAAGRASLDYMAHWSLALSPREDITVLWFDAAALEAFLELQPGEAARLEIDLGARRGGERQLVWGVEVGHFDSALHFADFNAADFD